MYRSRRVHESPKKKKDEKVREKQRSSTYHWANSLSDHLNNLCNHRLVVYAVSTDSNKRKRDLASQLVGDAKHGALHNSRVSRANFFKCRGGEPMPCHIDDVIRTGDNVQVPVLVRVSSIPRAVVACIKERGWLLSTSSTVRPACQHVLLFFLFFVFLFFLGGGCYSLAILALALGLVSNCTQPPNLKPYSKKKKKIEDKNI